MQAIETKFMPVTNSRGARIKAMCARGSLTISYPHELNGDEAHRAAASLLVGKFAEEDQKKYGTAPKKNPWLRPFFSGELKSGVHVHVFPI